MKLRLGGFYVNWLGEIVGPMYWYADCGFYADHPSKPDTLRVETYTAEGRVLLTGKSSPEDLVREWRPTFDMPGVGALKGSI